MLAAALHCPAAVSSISILIVLEVLAAGGASIIGGEPAPDDVGVVSLLGEGSIVPFCSGTLVAPDRVVTAAHCLFPPGTSMVPPAQIAVSRDGEVLETIDVVWAVAAPGFDRNTLAADVAVLGLAAPVTMAAPIAVRAAPLDAGDEGALARWIGFGFDQPGPTGELGVRRTVTAAIGGLEDDHLVASPITCLGDSGGAVMLDERLAAVVSSGGPGCTLYSKAARLDVVAGWLASWLDVAATCEPDGACALGCTTADADCLCPADGVCSACLAGGDDPDCVATGDECRSSRDCLGPCVDAVCRAACPPDGACGAGEACVDDASYGPICLPDGGGCQAAPRPEASVPIVLAALAAARRRRPRTPARRTTP